MRIAETVIVRVPPESVWERIADPRRWPQDLGRMHCVHVPGSPELGTGARYWLHLEVGAAEVGSLIEVLEYQPASALSWTTIEGFEQRGHWRLRDRGDGSSELSLSIGYQASGGLAALVTDEISSVFVRRYVRDALDTLGRRLDGRDRELAASGATMLLGRGAHALGEGVHATATLARARLIRPVRPDRYARALASLARRGQTLAGCYAAAAALYPTDPAVIDEFGSVTFAELQERVSRLAGALGERGVRAGQGIAVMCRNQRGIVETLLASAELDTETLLLDPDLAATQSARLIKRERPRTVIYDAEFAKQLSPSLRGRTGLIARAEDSDSQRRATLEQLIERGTPAVAPTSNGEARITTVIRDATGTPVDGTRACLPVGALFSILDSVALRSRERMLVAVPLSDQWGLAHVGLAALLAGSLVLRRRFDAEAALAAIERERVAHCAILPEMLEQLLGLSADVRRRYDTSSLRTIAVSGRPLPGSLASDFMDDYGEILYSIYGPPQLPWATIARPTELRRVPGTAGRPSRHTVVRVLDENGVPLRAGQTGRIFIANELLGERDRDDAAAPFDGLRATGDIGHLDDHGRLFVERPDPEVSSRAVDSAAAI